MTEKKSPKRRTQLTDLPRQEKDLSKDEQKKVKGGNLVVEAAQERRGGGSSQGVGSDFIEK